MICKKNTTLLSILIIFLFLIFFYVFTKKANKNPNKQAGDIVLELEKYNENISRIDSIFYESITSNTDLLRSNLYYKKNDTLFLESFLIGKESEIGLKDGIYWFWIKKFDSKNVYYCPKKEILNTRIQSPLNPNLIKLMTTIDPITPREINKNCLFEIKDDLVRKIFFYEKKISRQEIYKDGNLIFTCEFLDFYFENNCYLPKKIKITWHEENINAMLFFSKPKINITKDFDIPKINKINLLGY